MSIVERDGLRLQALGGTRIVSKVSIDRQIELSFKKKKSEISNVLWLPSPGIPVYFKHMLNSNLQSIEYRDRIDFVYEQY